MVQDIQGAHHAHTRRRIHQKHEPYPQPDKWKNIMDKAIYAVGVFGPLMTIPQIMNIWIEKNATGVSLITWSAYIVTAVFWLVYGIIHKDKPIIFSNSIWIVLDVLIVIGALIYS